MPKTPNLKRIRNEYPLTVRELAAKSGVSHDAITRIENGHREARPSTVRKLAQALGVEPRELMKGEG
jgi:transcriptional regulator with XRE-family HTH domain